MLLKIIKILSLLLIQKHIYSVLIFLFRNESTLIFISLQHFIKYLLTFRRKVPKTIIKKVFVISL